jgi:hypothetical protein
MVQVVEHLPSKWEAEFNLQDHPPKKKKKIKIWSNCFWVASVFYTLLAVYAHKYQYMCYIYICVIDNICQSLSLRNIQFVNWHDYCFI